MKIRGGGASKVSYSLIFDVDGEAYQKVDISTPKGLTLPVAPQKTGHSFAGWYKDKDIWLEPFNINEINYHQAVADITVYAKWNKNTYNVTLKRNIAEAGNTSFGVQSFEFGADVTINATVNNGYVFDGWFDNDVKLSEDTTYSFAIGAEPVTYTATYSVKDELKPFTFKSSPETIIITGVSDADIQNAVIPPCVSSIANGAFSGCDMLCSVIIDPSVTKIGARAFENCVSLESVCIPDSVTDVGEKAFFGCRNLKNVMLSERMNGLRAYTFSGCTGLLSISFPANITYIEGGAFEGCESLTSVNIPKTVTDMGSGVFKNCSSLNDLTIPFIGTNRDAVYSGNKFNYIFGGKDYVPVSLKSVTVTEGNIIRSSAFEYCSAIETINLPDTVTTIKSYAFNYCSALKNINIPQNLSSIGNNAFEYCDSLADITIPSTVYEIGDGVFRNCRGLKRAELKANVTDVESYMFSGCSMLDTVILPQTVTRISSDAFEGCSSLESISLPAQLKSIAMRAFANCSLLNVINYDNTIDSWNSLSKSTVWNSGTGSITVKCTDGDIMI